MNYTEILTRYTANFIDELAANGLRDVIISPGSRSTPLAVLFAEHKEINDMIVIDERSAAYFALGIAQANNRPVALVCTSGTAAANYFPAIVEAFYARVPLIVLTADRPHELRDIGASQTINQVNMYHHFVKRFYEMAPPGNDEGMVRYVRNRALRAMKIAKEGNPGPVHLNFPFKEPLMPDFTLDNLWGNRMHHEDMQLLSGRRSLSDGDLKALSHFMQERPNGLLVCGPQMDEQLGVAITALSEQLNIPILADPLSQLRSGTHSKHTIIATYDTIFRSEYARKKLKPDYIIRFGAMPVSKHFSFFINEHRGVTQFVVENNESVREPTNQNSRYILADSVRFCEELVSINNRQREDASWLVAWKKMDQTVKDYFNRMNDEKLTEGSIAKHVVDQLDDHSHLFVANSMPIRDIDSFFMPTNKSINVYANRGVSGIDGTLSSALGVATTGEPVTLLIGDLSFYHDLNSLFIAKRYNLRLNIILINNNGGGIFSFLPQAKEEKHFEHLFGTPLDIDFKHVVTMYGGNYCLVTTEAELLEALEKNRNVNSFSVIEVKTERKENVNWHREIWQDIAKRLERNDFV